MNESNYEEPELLPWEWEKILRKLDPQTVKFSRGFLKSRPERWVPQLAAEWLPLAHSLAADLRVLAVTPQLTLPEGLDVGYGAMIDKEPFGIYFDRDAIRMCLDAVVPASYPDSRDIVLEYMARRLVSSLRSSWVGAESSTIVFDKRIDPFSLKAAGAIQLSFSIGANQGAVWFGLGSRAVELLDGMWRRQNQPVVKNSPEGIVSLFFEIAQLAVPPADIVQYTQSGTKIDLEIPVTDMVLVRSADKPMASTRMSQADGKIVLETVALNPSQPLLPDGMTRISVVLAKVSCDTSVINENISINSMWDTGVALSDTVELYLNGDVMARGTLSIFEGRFALEVL